jgi:hypothetical protein
VLGTNLASDIEAVFNLPPASAHDAAVGLAQAYYDYVSLALFGASIPVITTAMRDTMAGTLEAGLGVPGAPPTAATAYSNAVSAFWSVPPVPVAGGSGTGVVDGCPGASSLVGSLSAVFANLANTQATAAAGIASALASATATVTATLTLPPNPPVVTPIG